jgi:hypothetical protein
MKRQILLLAITAAAFSSCTTAYKSGQTPDDVYFSPARPQDEYVRVEEKEEYRYNDDYYDDRYLRMKVHNRTRWSYLDDWYSYDRYGYQANYYYGSYYNPYTSWNYYHNPYCRNNIIIYHPGTSVAQQNNPKPRTFNIASYTNTNYNTGNNNINIKAYKPTAGRPVYSNTNSSKGLSNSIKQIFSNGNNSSSNNNSYSPPSRSYTPSSSSPASSNSSGSSGSSSGSSGSSGGGGGASRPSRGG